ncbi:putative 3Fe-4S ferredoxin, DnaJ domain, 4Fe-4S ferredoxin-type, iron-sulfur binding protein [Helianthus annuus]|nr:putative 3Fe-4S ferredoxin, DnaJ domain, 4Fe-4S ferredoxin-type, iron-sulfur binding protein [Helianthus annuus]KAJ0633068.1 putative 3Fe-4S ferredoxin, DnaJ domain, 4Fe-4S ferredoxin-type, iron-sulfur binding protein [Helianthus annuus]KAJ0827103.1 putative 3Fe-4S ferredoxin, DnaJ domain, 4Fe-4S ferredoxin-type, iron-sulfur binding protein [Helianthus annuus]
MAHLLSPVAIQFQKGWSSGSNSCHRMLATSMRWNARGRPRRSVRLKVATDPSPFSSDALADDYYAVLGLLPDATPEQIKKAYYNCMKSCHPDLSGDDPETTNFCMFINEVYEVLSDPAQRMVYDEIHGYALSAINPFLDDTYPKDHVFVDEFSCIGCKNCANVCSDVFMIEEDYGRARACNQQGSPDLVQQAIDSCPVDCIHWTSAAQLSLLEDEMRRVERVNVALMLAGMGSSADVFRMASTRWEKRQNKILEQARIRMMKSNDKAEPYWTNLWGNAKNQPSTEEEVRERASRAAAAARRWREYSRRGVDKPATYKLPDNLSTTEK